VRKLQLIERLTERNLIAEFFDELAGGPARGDLLGRAGRLGYDLAQPHLVLVAGPADEALERAIVAAVPGVLADRRDDLVRALVRIPRGGDAQRVAELLTRAVGAAGARISVGLSRPCASAAGYPDAFAEAEQARIGAAVLHEGSAVVAFDDLGAYRYLLPLALDGPATDATIGALERLVAYDSARGAALLRTLEELLHRHGSISATADALHVHQNTLRQRLRRIQEVSGLDLRREDWLTVEIAVKLVRLRAALAAAEPDTPSS
jgi:sugar diacid utilization regulator